MAYLWAGKFSYHHALWSWVTYGGAALLVLLNHFVHHDNPKRMGLRLDNFRAGAKLFGGFTLLAGGVIAAAGLRWGEFGRIGADAAVVYALWAVLQQHLLQNFLRLRSGEIFPLWCRSWAGVLLAASLFALYHLPNPSLMVFSFLGAAAWCAFFSRVPSLPWAAFSQTALTLLLVVFFKFNLLDQFAVGKPGYRYDFYGGGVKVAGGVDSTGAPFVATVPGPDRGVSALVRIFDPAGARKTEWVAFEGLDFSAELAVGDLGFGPGDEIVLTPGPGAGNPSLLRIFTPEGERLGEFEVPELDQGYGLWTSIACGKIYVCPGPAPGAKATVLEMAPDGRPLNRWSFENLGLVNGVRAAAVCGEREGRLLLWGTDVSVNPSTVFVFDRAGGSPLGQFETLKTTFGVQIALAGRGDETKLAAAPGPLQGYPLWVRVFDLTGRRLYEFAGEISGQTGCGANLASIDVEGDGVPEWLVGDGACPGQPPLVRVHALDGRPIRSWRAY